MVPPATVLLKEAAELGSKATDACTAILVGRTGRAQVEPTSAESGPVDTGLALGAATT